MIFILYNFTYKDYIKCIHNVKQINYCMLEEEKEKYIIQNNNAKIMYKKILENLFKDKERIITLLDRFTDNNKIKKVKELIYVDEFKEDTTVKIIYKESNTNIFYLIIYQQEINLNLPYIILNDCIKIIKKNKKNNFKRISIIPIVIYLKDTLYYQDELTDLYFKIATYDNNILELKYNLIRLTNVFNMKNIENTILEDLIYIETLNK